MERDEKPFCWNKRSFLFPSKNNECMAIPPLPLEDFNVDGKIWIHMLYKQTSKIHKRARAHTQGQLSSFTNLLRDNGYEWRQRTQFPQTSPTRRKRHQFSTKLYWKLSKKQHQGNDKQQRKRKSNEREREREENGDSRSLFGDHQKRRNSSKSSSNQTKKMAEFQARLLYLFPFRRSPVCNSRIAPNRSRNPSRKLTFSASLLSSRLPSSLCAQERAGREKPSFTVRMVFPESVYC